MSEETKPDVRGVLVLLLIAAQASMSKALDQKDQKNANESLPTSQIIDLKSVVVAANCTLGDLVVVVHSVSSDQLCLLVEHRITQRQWHRLITSKHLPELRLLQPSPATIEHLRQLLCDGLQRKDGCALSAKWLCDNPSV